MSGTYQGVLFADGVSLTEGHAQLTADGKPNLWVSSRLRREIQKIDVRLANFFLMRHLWTRTGCITSTTLRNGLIFLILTICSWTNFYAESGYLWW